MAHDVFISYSSKDKPIADAICANLEDTAIRCWIAPRDIAPGEDWPTAIARAIAQSRVMVLIFSASSNSSEDVGREIILAANSKLVIIPFKIEDIEPEPGKQYYLARTHWLDAINPPTEEQIGILVDRVTALLPVGGTPGTVASQPLAPKPAAGSGPGWLRYIWIPVTIAVLVCLAVVSAALLVATHILPLPLAAPAAASPTATLPPPATLTPTAVPPPTATAEPAILFQDDFSSNAHGWEIGKESDDIGTVDKEIVDGKYRWTLKSKKDYFVALALIPHFSAKDFVFSIDTTVVDTSAAPGNLDVEYTFREVNGVNGKRYDFNFYNNNRYSIDVWPSADYKSLMNVLKGEVGTVILKKGNKNTFTIEAKGSTFTFYINGNKINSFTDATIDEAGSMSLWLTLDNAGDSATVDFDDLVIKGSP